VLSAGGVNRGLISRIRARETFLLLDDGVEETALCFRIPGAGHDWMGWNNTGVHERFAVGPANVLVPPQYVPEAEDGGWTVYEPGTVEGLLIAAYNAEHLGLLALFPESPKSPEELLAALQEANPSAESLRSSFSWPEGGSIRYDVYAPKGTYVIAEVDGMGVPRHYDAWPLIKGDPPRLTFDRSAEIRAAAAEGQ